MMAMDSIKFRSVHLMDDGDGHHNFGIDGDGDGHHFKGDGRHVWFWYYPESSKPIFLYKELGPDCLESTILKITDKNL